MYEMQGPRLALPRLANRLLGCSALPGRPTATGRPPSVPVTRLLGRFLELPPGSAPVFGG